MAIIKRSNDTFQVKFRDGNRKWICKSFAAKKDAVAFETQIKQQKQTGTLATNSARQLTLNDYFVLWFETVEHQASTGWRKSQIQLYRSYVAPELGDKKLLAINPPSIAKVLSEVKKKGKAEQTQGHVYSLLRKMFGDAIELFQLATYNPALKSLKPKIPVKEARHLSVEQVRKLLLHVAEKEYGLAVWLQLYLGLRIGELQALTWDDIDLDEALVRIRRAYCRMDSWASKEKVIREYPKGRRQHTKTIPVELLEMLRKAKIGSTSDFVVKSPEGEMLSYEWYFQSLKRYCHELELPVIGTHGLRHSTAGVYLIHGATKDDLRTLFAHSCSSVTERYTHGEGNNLKKVTNVIRLFGTECSQNVPKTGSTR